MQLTATVAIAQSLSARDPFAISLRPPTSCGFRQLTRADSAKSIGLLYILRDQNPATGPREVRVWYDFSDVPVKLSASILETTSRGSLEIYVTRESVVWFARGGTGKSVGVRSDPLREPSEVIPESPAAAGHGWTRLSPKEIERAKALAVWMPGHACHKPPPGSFPPR